MRGDEQRPGRDGCRRARALGVGGLERAVRDNGAPELLSRRGATCPLARTSRAVAAGAECPRHRRTHFDEPRGAMDQPDAPRSKQQELLNNGFLRRLILIAHKPEKTSFTHTSPLW